MLQEARQDEMSSAVSSPDVPQFGIPAGEP
jgi:hypothetical protein